VLPFGVVEFECFRKRVEDAVGDAPAGFPFEAV
jgi:hypothetical protein